jgi:hypothetical protein
MNQETVNLQIPFESLVNEIASLGLEDLTVPNTQVNVNLKIPVSCFSPRGRHNN